MRSFRGRRPRLAVLLGAIALVLSGLVATPAQAAPNGQQVIVESLYRFTAVRIEGYNQNWQWRDTNWFGGVSTYWCKIDRKCYFTGMAGWWWKGTVKIKIWDQNNGWKMSATCDVPTNQSGYDWRSCWVPRRY